MNTSCDITCAESADSSTRSGITTFDFHNKVFSVDGARFALHQPDLEARFHVNLGDMQASTDLNALRSQFAIESHTHDGRLLQIVVRSLKFVDDIRPGDSIPTEILDGSASWTVKQKHREIAKQRLQVQLLSWVSGKEILITDPKELEAFLGQLENRTKLKDAFGRAAEALGGDAKNPEPVLKQLELLTRELCYIEALRDRFLVVKSVREKLAQLKLQYERDARQREEIHRMGMLLNRAIITYDKQFTEVDAQTSEIIGAIKSLAQQVKYIRRVRDDLHFTTKDWNAILERWESASLKKSKPVDTLLADTYRLLAVRFATSKSLVEKTD